ncbi:hypothetical protein MRX96_053367 [Rhipicephalus microplus]
MSVSQGLVSSLCPCGSYGHFEDFHNVVADFERYHSYIQWMIAAPDHDQVQKTLSGHLCQVFSVTYYDVNAPLDGYTGLAKNVARSPQCNSACSENACQNAGRLPKDDRVVFAAQDNNFNLCYKKDKVMPLIRRAYATVNTSLVEVCNNGETESLLLDRRVDFVVQVSKRVPMRSYYGYVML